MLCVGACERDPRPFRAKHKRGVPQGGGNSQAQIGSFAHERKKTAVNTGPERLDNHAGLNLFSLLFIKASASRDV